MYPAKLFCFTSALILTLSGCTTTTQENGNDVLLGQCFSAALVEGSQAGLQFTNNCDACVAVSFDTQSLVSDENGRNACYVPAKTRVVFSKLRGYRISALRECDRVQQEGSIDGVPAAMLTQNYQSKRCAIIGEFDD